MTQPVPQYTVGVDVSKRTLDCYKLATDHSSVIANAAESIEQWLDRWSGPIRLAMEPTNTYHLAIAHAAHARGHPVYLVDPYRLTHYRAGIGQRVKADGQDARLLARYLQHEAAELRRWEPLQQGPQEFWRLLKRRATLVQTVTRMQQSLSDLGSLQADVDALIEPCRTTVKKFDQALLAQAMALGWAAQVHRCQGIPGVGPLTALAMVATYQRAQFRNDDAFIAVMGMDVRIRESGQYRGRRKLTKQGEPELRRLLFNAAMQGRRNPHWQPYYLALRERGLSSTAAFIALGRKIARLCFVLLRNEVDFQPNFHSGACMAT
jgi:transposase